MTASARHRVSGGPSPISAPVWRWSLPAIWIVLLVFVSQFAYAWFHSLAELFTVVIGVSLYLIAIQTFSFTGNRYLLVVAIGFFWSSVIDIFHTLTYEGMGQASHYPPDTPPLLWMCARSLQVAAFLLAPVLARTSYSKRHIFLSFGAAGTLLTVAVFEDLMPTAWIAGQGLTPFKIAWEWLLMLGYCIAALQLTQDKAGADPVLRRALLLVMALGVGTELCFTWYVTMYGLSNMAGHLLKLMAYWAMLLVISQHMLTRPKDLLDEQARLLGKIVGQVPGMTYVLERTAGGLYRIPFVSPGIADMLELNAQDVANDATAALERIAPEHRERLARTLDDCAAERSAWNTTWEVLLPQQGRRWHQGSSAMPEKQTDGSCVWVAYVHDITDQKRMELELMRHRDQLTALVDDRTEELRQALFRAENSARAKSEFLANMSHEIRTPLNAVVGLAQVGLRTRQVEVAWPYLAQIQDSGRMLMSLINDVLDMAKVEAGKLTLEVRPIDLLAVLQRAVKLMSPHAEAKSLHLVLDCDASLPPAIMGDENRLLQVLVNLMSNAVKFTDRGSVKVSAMATLAGEGGVLVLSVIDTGIGIASDQIARLFNPFEQAAASTARQYGGTGLGLSICRQIVELMGGRIDLSSQPGAGSCFTIRLPFQLASKPVNTQRAPHIVLEENPLRLKGVRILCAEDDAVNQWVLRELLEQEGAECTLRNNGLDALIDLRSNQPFDVFITDIQMPGLNGYDTTKRALQQRPYLPVLGLTAFAMPEDRQKCLDAGMRDHISKPVDADALVLAIQNVLQKETDAAGDSVPDNQSATQLAPVANVDWIDLQKTLRRPQSRVKFLQTFMDSYATAPATLRTLLNNNDMDAVQPLVHKIHGAAGFLCARSTQQQARTIEERILHTRTLPVDQVSALADTLEQVVQEVGEKLKLLQESVV